MLTTTSATSANMMNMLIHDTASGLDDDMYRHERDITRIESDLLRGELSTVANIDLNRDKLILCQDIIDRIPKITDIKQNKPVIPEFDEVETRKSDTVEIKKFIRKVNYEFLGYHCNHKTMDKECDLLTTHVATLYNSPEFKEYKQFLRKIARIVWNIRKRDDMNKRWKEDHLLPLPSEIDKIVNVFVKIVGKINEYNAKMNPVCSKCKAAVRKHTYAIKEIQRMRDEQLEIEEMKNAPIEDARPPPIEEFIAERFDGIDRFKLSEVKDSYKKLYGINKTLAQLRQDIEEIGGYKVTNCQRIYWVTKL
jgi:hypothetical protein